MSNAVRASLRQAGLQDSVRVVDIPPENLKQQLVRNRAYDRLCETPNCIVRPNGRQGAHRTQCHDNTPFKIAVTILARESDVLARKTLEAFYITAKSPIMNRKEECIAVTSSEEGDDAETLPRIKINNNLGSA
ncbi:hypothetical protein RB195_024893 [Necator americanus]|uniref:Uncharacterized protein n=1 Tax=Necator americanus TaxID=51031 RepID=A0ABR1EQK7_NECAM